MNKLEQIRQESKEIKDKIDDTEAVSYTNLNTWNFLYFIISYMYMIC